MIVCVSDIVSDDMQRAAHFMDKHFKTVLTHLKSQSCPSLLCFPRGIIIMKAAELVRVLNETAGIHETIQTLRFIDCSFGKPFFVQLLSAVLDRFGNINCVEFITCNKAPSDSHSQQLPDASQVQAQTASSPKLLLSPRVPQSPRSFAPSLTPRSSRSNISRSIVGSPLSKADQLLSPRSPDKKLSVRAGAC